MNLEICLRKYEKLEKGLESEFKKLLLAIFTDNRFETHINFCQLSQEVVPVYTLPPEFNISTFLATNGQNLYSFCESLLQTETQKLLLHQMFGDQYLVSIDWNKCSAEQLPYYLIDIYGNYLNWSILIKHNEIPSNILTKYEHCFLNGLYD
jgi:hypothetical protein